MFLSADNPRKIPISKTNTKASIKIGRLSDAYRTPIGRLSDVWSNRTLRCLFLGLVFLDVKMSKLDSAKRRILDWNLKSDEVLQAYRKADKWHSPFSTEEVQELYNTLNRLRCSTVSERWKKYEMIDILLNERDYMMVKLKEVDINPATDFDKARDYFVANPIPMFHKKGITEAFRLSKEVTERFFNPNAPGAAVAAPVDGMITALTTELDTCKETVTRAKTNI